MDGNGAVVRKLDRVSQEIDDDLPEPFGVADQRFGDIRSNFQLQLNRAGKFTVELDATDEIAKKTTSQSFDVLVQELLK